MATKYAGQNSLNKLMSLIKNAIPKKTSDLTNDSGFITGADIPEGAAASSATPKMDGTAAAGTSNAFARGDHVHPSDTSRVNKAGDTMTGPLTVEEGVTGKSFRIKKDGLQVDCMAVSGADATYLMLGETSGVDSIPVRINGVSEPNSDEDAANKAYVDGKAPYVVTATVTSGSASATMSDTRDNIKAKLDANIPVVGYIIEESGAVWEASVSWGGASILMEATMRGNNGTWHGHVDFSGTGTTAYYYGKTVSDGVTSSDVSEMIASAISGVYTPKGTIAFASLPTASAGNLGWVYNISGAFTTTAAFVEGAGKSYGAGTNVVCVDAGSGTYQWDVLAGTIDLEELTAVEVQAIWDSV